MKLSASALGLVPLAALASLATANFDIYFTPTFYVLGPFWRYTYSVFEAEGNCALHREAKRFLERTDVSGDKRGVRCEQTKDTPGEPCHRDVSYYLSPSGQIW
jgi:hypothetical protein